MNALRGTLRRFFTRGKSTPPAARRRRFLPQLEQLDARIVPSLTPVGYNAGNPFSAVAQVSVTFPNHKSYVGSGAMIDRFHLLTAAHMLYSPADGGWATSVQVIPDKYYSYDPRGYALGTYLRVDPSWRGTISSSVEDVGLVTLNSTIGDYTGWFGFGYNSNNNFFTNQYFETAGYPASNGYNGQQMYYSYGRITGEQGTELLSTEGNITNIPGQSGSPLWYTPNGCIYGINSAWSGSTASSSQDYFARITQSVFNELQSWRNSDRTPTGPIQRAATVTGGLNGFTSFTTSAGLGQYLTDVSVSSNPTDGVPGSLLVGAHSLETAPVVTFATAGSAKPQAPAFAGGAAAAADTTPSFLRSGTDANDLSSLGHAQLVDTLFAQGIAAEFGVSDLSEF